jgi:hypothetical protein
MFRLKTVGVLMAIVALCAATASSASAFTEFLSSPVGQEILADQTTTHIFTVEEKEVTCTTAHFSAKSATEAFTEILVTPVYSGCTAFTFIKSEVLMNECDFDLHINGTVDILCPTGKSIEIDVNNGSGCVITIGAQNGLKGITYENVTGKNGRLSVDILINVTGIAATSNGKGLGCPTAGAHTGTYTGSAVAEGDGTNGTVDVV